ncbi:hypothetical protein [Pleionea litopenaei]|uniref:Uncharacterized protein n=1 Tax=Pleionea litopenaei TaxID=3070815 RepID=A0AA51RW48_9GAMM|nr:hypothetical protein [Pleionea sp. HL-JVS1]WMS88743.1 hypothetical protein Q9312_07450 [Pleionea sp. HL-JVS1]
MELKSGYRVPYEPWSAIERLKKDKGSALDELWENLYHQGDVDTASYASVPLLVENGCLDLVSAIEVARNREGNPDIPYELQEKYFSALKSVIENVPKDLESLKAYYVIHASLHNQMELARVLDFISIEEVLNEIE